MALVSLPSLLVMLNVTLDHTLPPAPVLLVKDRGKSSQLPILSGLLTTTRGLEGLLDRVKLTLKPLGVALRSFVKDHELQALFPFVHLALIASSFNIKVSPTLGNRLSSPSVSTTGSLTKHSISLINVHIDTWDIGKLKRRPHLKLLLLRALSVLLSKSTLM
jgi:hypothetical protein